MKPDTVRGWLQRAAGHSEDVNKILMKDLKASKVEPDERRLWVSYAPEHRLLLDIHIGPRTKESVDAIVERGGERIDDAELPLFVSDGLKYCIDALLGRYHHIGTSKTEIGSCLDNIQHPRHHPMNLQSSG